jgi:hypothetical protein
MTTPLEAAGAYLEKGWHSVPIPAKQKRPVLDGWPTLRLGAADLPEYFDGRGNVGLLTGEPSGGLIDIDLDCDEAVALAPVLLPETPMRSGRPSRPRSHHWYVTTPIPENATFKDIDGTTLVELRGTGRQTVVAPSEHPEGEPYRWEGPLEPAAVSGDVLAAAGRRLAAATLLVRHWPRRPGSRHDIANALAGLVARGGWAADEAASFIRAVAQAAGDEEAASRARDALATARTLARGGKVTGGPTLAALLSDQVVAKAREWLGLRAAIEVGAAPRLPEPAPWPDPLGEAAYHGLAGQFVRVVSPHSEADPAALYFQFVVKAGNLLGRRAYVQVEDDRHYPNLFTGIVGTSSKSRKGTSHGRVHRPFLIVDEGWAQKRTMGGLSTGEGIIVNVRDAVVGDDGEVEEPGAPDKRLMIYEPELAQALKVLNREGNTLSPVIRQAWDGVPLRILNKNSPATATEAHISIIAHITKGELTRLLTETEKGNGFANRFLWVMAQRARLLPRGGRLTDTDLVPIVTELRAALAFVTTVGAREVTWDEEAGEHWDAIYGPLSAGGTGLAAEVTSRAEAQVLRLALVHALLDRSPVIRLPHLLAAEEAWRYCEASARYLFGDALGDPVADDILAALRRAGGAGLQRNDLMNLFGRNRRSDEIGRALAVLLERGLVRCERNRTGEPGRPPEQWFAREGYERNETTRDADAGAAEFARFSRLSRAPGEATEPSASGGLRPGAPEASPAAASGPGDSGSAEDEVVEWRA